MQCPTCQQDNRDGRRFCGECGAPLPAPCPACGFANEPAEKFCGGCGAPLATTPASRAPASASAAPTASPRDYTPQHLADRILTSRAALQDERKQVTVLFADLKGSMELLADRDPEEARAILDPVLERMMEAVHRYEGTVNQVMGDGIMALFGAPLAHEDHAVRACYAALRMQEGVRQYAEEVRRREGLAIQVRVGLNSGEVVVRSIGSDLRMDYTAVGQTTHLAARMEQMALAGSTLLAPDTLRLVEGFVQVKALGPMQIKGLGEPVEVYELIGAGTVRSRLQAAAARGLTKFVGRDAELDTLRRTLDQAGTGHGQIVALVGEPGVGKSRLVWEFSHSHRTQDWLVLESRSVSYGKATAYLPVIDLLKSYCGIEVQDDQRRIREKVVGKLLNLDRALEPTLPAFLALLDVSVDDPAWQALDPPQRRQRTLDAVKRLLLRESQEQPLLLLFEDLHWIDSETQALLDSLIESLPTARMLLLVNYRPEYEHAWHRKTYYQQLRLDPFSPERAEELVQALVGDDARLGQLQHFLIERTEGNPFFLEESVRTLVETGTLVGERGAYRLTSPLERTQVPATVQAVLAARIDRLTADDKRLLQAAAVIGKDLPYALLAAIAELPEGTLREGLGRLQGAEFLYETSLFPDSEYTFKHALTHEVAYGSLLGERRRALHARIVERIEARFPDRLVEQAERLAYHAFRGERWSQAARYLRQAATKAAERSAHREAVGYFEQALEALQHLPPDQEATEQAVDIRFELRNSLQPLAAYTRLQEHLREAEALARLLGDRRRLGWVQAYAGNLATWLGDCVGAVLALEHSRAVAREVGDFGLELLATQFLATGCYMLGDYSRAVELLRNNWDAIRGDSAREGVGAIAPAGQGSLSFLVLALAERGDFADALACGEELRRIVAESTNAFIKSYTPYAVGERYLRKGDLGEATGLLTDALRLAEEYRILTFQWRVASALGYTLTQRGSLGEALPLLERAVERAAASAELGGHSLRLCRLGEAYLQAGRAGEASGCAAQALALARRQSERGHEAWARRLLGEIAAHADPLQMDEAESHYNAALARADELGMRPLAAHCHLGLGSLYRKVGRNEQAQVELASAAEMYRAMEMTYWLARAEGELEQMRAAL
jgi:class 3 adenylate cyclase/tetratricopeptide (TPR) repeat protein